MIAAVVAGKVGIPLRGRDSQARWKSGLYFSRERLFRNLLPLASIAPTMRGPCLPLATSLWSVR